ncbi:CPXCG motif-containing cysteine-rich protein [Aliikangiella marina]|uniref:CPXCG motif-containing cysteine-rich protein n=1 Tax=Aliikangiella marina TaxID=1712262 RepID=A0A545T4S7_9GAMM|nr:CPXCG motif-containing cysteine-rich protein [Aliikangiella marina]TQV72231.1 CPXCG motif-containing cysteine-rich protein [Aliikangiella marina]
MNNELLEQSVQCPYCWETINVLVDTSDADQSYIEDCQVCCRPIVFEISQDMAGYCQVIVKSEDD